jgi:predicted TIM-barrel fold metal-dependent hydrolase
VVEDGPARLRRCPGHEFLSLSAAGFRDLYGVDFDTITADEARRLNDRIFANYKDDKWLIDVITRRANIELMFIDSYWARLQFARAYQFSVPILNVTEIMRGSHRARLGDADSPYQFAEKQGMKINDLNDYLIVVDKIFADAVAADAVCLKSTQAYQRTLRYEDVPKERAAAAFGKSPDAITPAEQKDFEDFMFWQIVQRSAKHDLPFQIHTGHGRLQGSSPMLLLDVIEANPKTKFVLFHGGFPWVGETAAIAMRHRNVWIDSVWLPTLSYTMARRAYQEWLEAVPADRIMWGADTVQAEGIYAATEFTRQCLAEALAEKVQRGELREEHASRIGRQVLRDNALKLFPKLERFLWREKEQ